MTLLSDIRNDLKKLTVTRRDVWTLVVTLFALAGLIEWLWYDFRGTESLLLFVCGALLLFLAAARWSVLIPLYRTWMFLALLLGWFVMRILLTMMFITVFTPISLILRLMGKDLLMKKKDATKKSYWLPVDVPKGTSRYLKKF